MIDSSKEKHMIKIRKSSERGMANHGWLKSKHTFSFAGYYDPKHINFSDLRVINEDEIDGGSGFGEHPHRDMEIISYAIEGSLRHQDSMGNKTVISPGEVQRMSAGTGIVHSEYNNEKDKPTHFFQIWIMPEKQGIKPSYEQKSFADELNKNKLTMVISPNGDNGSLKINQDAKMYISRLKSNEALDFPIENNRKVWVQVVKGSLKINTFDLEAGDAMGLTQEVAISMKSKDDSEVILFDLANR